MAASSSVGSSSGSDELHSFMGGDGAVDSMVALAEQAVESSTLDQIASRAQRFAVAEQYERRLGPHGAYGEFPLRGMAELLQHPSVRDVASRPSARFVEFGSGAGRLVLGVAVMQPNWGGVTGIEAVEGLHNIADAAIRVAEAKGAVPEAICETIHSPDGLPHDDPSAEAFASADVAFLYSTTFPSEDGLRLPRISASLASVLPAGAVVITTDKWLVGERFVFDALLPIVGEDGERIYAMVWRVVGEAAGPGGFDMSLEEIEANWSGEDACADNPPACDAMLQTIEAEGLGDDVM